MSIRHGLCAPHSETRNLTLAIDGDLVDEVRVLAAMKRTGVNEMVRDFLARVVEQEDEHAPHPEDRRCGRLIAPASVGDWLTRLHL